MLKRLFVSGLAGPPGCWLALSLLLPGALRAQDYSISEVALPGDPAPGTGGGTYSDFGAPSLNASGDTDIAVALQGVRPLAPGGGAFLDFDLASTFNDSGDVAFIAHLSGGTAAEGIFFAEGPEGFLADLELRFGFGTLAPVMIETKGVEVQVGVSGGTKRDTLAIPSLSAASVVGTTPASLAISVAAGSGILMRKNNGSITGTLPILGGLARRSRQSCRFSSPPSPRRLA